jgi:hypothetical protein
MISIIVTFFIPFFFYYMIARKAPTDYDTYGHLHIAKEVKEQKSGPFGEIKLKVMENNGFSHLFLW